LEDINNRENKWQEIKKEESLEERRNRRSEQMQFHSSLIANIKIDTFSVRSKSL
jgi:hypothetical protein